MEKIIEFYKRAKKLYAAIAASTLPIIAAVDQIVADGKINLDDQASIVTIGSLVLGWFGVYWATNKVGNIERKR